MLASRGHCTDGGCAQGRGPSPQCPAKLKDSSLQFKDSLSKVQYPALLFTSPGQSGVCVSVDKEFHVEEVSDVLEVEHEDPLQQDHVRGSDVAILSLLTRVGLEIVDRDPGGLSLLDLL